ncbi:hypothetical protein EDB87DRAFT_806692 [Lactarius vividus]|nr:hypothetical protein EDB87DRAFT_806692 [Lactarius vividus]
MTGQLVLVGIATTAADALHEQHRGLNGVKCIYKLKRTEKEVEIMRTVTVGTSWTTWDYCIMQEGRTGSTYIYIHWTSEKGSVRLRENIETVEGCTCTVVRYALLCAAKGCPADASPSGKFN